MNNRLESITIDCPYCGEIIDILVDCSQTHQDYIEDCQICCRPIKMVASVDEETGMPFVIATSENDC
jgi:hypothetical protein